MITEQLIINGVEVELLGSLMPNLTFNIQDISEPDKRKATFSKSIALPGSKTINDLFNFIFEINIEGTFNPNLKATAQYLVDSQMVLDGILQLKSIKYLDNSDIEYEVVLLGTIANLFSELGEKELTDIQDLSDFDHPYTEVHQALTWDTSILINGAVTPFQMGQGYLYPMINYGADNTLDSYDYDEMYPAMFVKELWDRIFADAGYTYTSNFLNIDKRFKNAIIPFNSLGFGLTTSQINDRTFKADTPSFITSMVGQNGSAQSLVNFIDVTDAGNVHNAGVFTAPSTGQYTFQAEIDLYANFIPDPAATESVRANTYLSTTVFIEQNGVNQDSVNMIIAPDYTYNFPIGGNYTTATAPTYPNNGYNTGGISGSYPFIYSPRQYNPPNKVVVNSSTLWCNAGDTVTVKVYVLEKILVSGVGEYYDPVGTNEYGGTFDIAITGTGSFKNQAINSEYMYNDTVDMNGAIPKDVKQKDFVKGIINQFNLYVEPDLDNPNNLKIEERDTFLTPAVENWSSKLDVSQDLVLTPMGLLDAGRYLYKHKDDKDYYNQMYKDTYDQTFGQREIIINNDFISKENKQEVIFSPTPLVGQSSNDRVISTILKTNTNGAAQRTDSNIRYLIYDGLKDTASLWTHRTTVRSTYPYAGHLYPDPFNPTLDVNFGLPKEIYYDSTFYPIALTDNNLYNSLHRKQVEEITDKDSKIVKGMFYLTPLDVATLSFRPQYYFNEAYHRLLKVVNYNPAGGGLTECTFLKLKTAEAYTTITLVPGGKDETVGSGAGSTEPLPTVNLFQNSLADGNTYNNRSGDINGIDNYANYSVKSFNITGDGNNISDGAKNITIQGDNNFIESNLENVVLINTSNVTVTESNVTYINGVVKAGSEMVEQKSANFTANNLVTTYEISGNVRVDIDFDTLTEGKIWEFKKTSISGVITLLGINGATLEGQPSMDITQLDTCLTFRYDGGTNFIII